MSFPTPWGSPKECAELGGLQWDVLFELKPCFLQTWKTYQLWFLAACSPLETVVMFPLVTVLNFWSMLTEPRCPSWVLLSTHSSLNWMCHWASAYWLESLLPHMCFYWVHSHYELYRKQGSKLRPWDNVKARVTNCPLPMNFQLPRLCE